METVNTSQVKYSQTYFVSYKIGAIQQLESGRNINMFVNGVFYILLLRVSWTLAKRAWWRQLMFLDIFIYSVQFGQPVNYIAIFIYINQSIFSKKIQTTHIYIKDAKLVVFLC